MKKFSLKLVQSGLIVLLCLTAVWCTACGGDKTPSYYDQKVNIFKAENPSLLPGQIVFLGDSITDLWPLNNYFADLPLRTYNRGIGGDTTTGLFPRLKVSAYDLAPSKIVLMIGVNDIDGGRSVNQIVKTYRKILTGLQNHLPQTELYLMSVLAQHEQLMTYTSLDISVTIPQIKQLNTQIMALADEYHATYLDLFSLTATEDDKLITTYSDDGIHLNAAGFTVWADLLRPYLAV